MHTTFKKNFKNCVNCPWPFAGEGSILGGRWCRGVDWNGPRTPDVTESQTGHRGNSHSHQLPGQGKWSVNSRDLTGR